MLADPAEARAHGPSLVHHRLNVNANFPDRLRPLGSNPSEQRFQLFADHIMIIVAPRVTRNLSGRGIIRVFIRSKIIERDDDDRARFWKKQARVSALLWVARHPLHLAMKPALKPLLQ